MNDSTQAMVTDAPRRSGRERRQAESIYADARLAEKKKRAAMNDSKSSDRSVRWVNLSNFPFWSIHIYLLISSCRYRKRKAEDEEEEDEDEEGRLEIFSDEEEEEEVVNSDRVKPTISRSREWNSLGTSRIQGSLTEQQNQADNIRSAFVSIDGETLYRNYSYYSHFDGEFRRHTSLNWDAPGALAAAQKSLVAEQDQHSISLEHIFHRDSNISQVPYRKFHCLQLFCNSVCICICFVLTHAPRSISYPRRGYDALLRLFCRRHSKLYFPWVIQGRQFQPAPIALATEQNISRPGTK